MKNFVHFVSPLSENLKAMHRGYPGPRTIRWRARRLWNRSWNRRREFLRCLVSLFFALVSVFSLIVSAQQGTYQTITTTWNGIPRSYFVYRPKILPANPLLVVALHGTFTGPQSAAPPNICHTQGLDIMADPLGILLLCPIASWKSRGATGVRFWNSYGTDADFPVVPDDAGLLRSLILLMEQPVTAGGYGVSHVYGAIGMSSGAMMVDRLCIESADLVPACAIESGTLWVGATPPTIPIPSQPVSILNMHGDADTTLYYCGGWFAGWGNGRVWTQSVDVDINYWIAADGMPANSTPLCVNTMPSTMERFDARVGSVEIEFQRLDGYAHQFAWWETSAAFEFFSTHQR